MASPKDTEIFRRKRTQRVRIRRADFPVCRLGGFPAARSSARQPASEPDRQLVIGNTELESSVNRQTGKSALHRAPARGRSPEGGGRREEKQFTETDLHQPLERPLKIGSKINRFVQAPTQPGLFCAYFWNRQHDGVRQDSYFLPQARQVRWRWPEVNGVDIC
jgi:hypothetical protein